MPLSHQPQKLFDENSLKQGNIFHDYSFRRFFYCIFAADLELIGKILKASDDLFMRFGIRSVSMDDVAKHLSISKKTLYKCFRDKNDLVRTAIAEHIGQMDIQINAIIHAEPNPVLQIGSIADFVSQVHKNLNPSLMYDLQKYHPEVYEDFKKHRDTNTCESVKQNLKTGIETGLYRNDINIEMYTLFYTTLVYASLDPAMMNTSLTGFENTLKEIVKYHLMAITTEKGRETMKSIPWIKENTVNETV